MNFEKNKKLFQALTLLGPDATLRDVERAESDIDRALEGGAFALADYREKTYGLKLWRVLKVNQKNLALKTARDIIVDHIVPNFRSSFEIQVVLERIGLQLQKAEIAAENEK